MDERYKGLSLKQLSILVPIQALFLTGAFFGEFIQSNPEYYFWLLSLFGKGVADFAIGHMGDLSSVSHIPITSVLALQIALSFTNIRKEEANKYLLNMAVISGAVIGIFGMVGELYDMFDPLVGSKCGNPNYTCRGDWGDVLSFSAPLIAGVSFIALNRLRSRSKLFSK